MANILITGCSTGIGLATALRLGRAGHRVFATMRNPGKSPELARTALAEQLPVTIHTMDVDSDESVKRCFVGIPEPIEALVNNAGVEAFGSVEEMPVQTFAAVMNTNYLGTLRCIKAVLPQMRERRSGCIVNISSVAGRISNSPLTAYCASKYAVEALSEGLAGEVKPFGIRVAIVEPGMQATRMARAIRDASGRGSIYPQAARFPGLFRAAMEAAPVPPEATAAVIQEIVESGTWQLRHLPGPNAAPFLQWRAAMTDEEWVEWSAQDDESWYAAVERDFDLDARPLRRQAAD